MMKKTLLGMGLAIASVSSLLAAEHGNKCGDGFCGLGNCSDWEWEASVDWLYWKVRHGSLDYMFTDNGSAYLIGHCQAVEPDFDHGVRLNVNVQTDCCMDFGATYTYFGANDNDLSFNGSATWYPPRLFPDTMTVTYGRSDYDLDMHMIDFTTGYWVETQCDVMIRPFSGFRIAMIDQEVKTRYANNDTIDDFTGHQVYDVTETLEMDAYGALLGMDSEWKFWCDFSLVGHIAGMVGYAEFDAQYHLRDVDTTTVDIDFHCESKRIISMLELSSAVKYEFNCWDCVDLYVMAGWEYQTWFNMMDFINFTDEDDRSQVSRNNQVFGLDGLFVRLGGKF